MAPASREEPVVAGHTEVSHPLRRSTPTSDSCTGAGQAGTGVRAGLPPALPEPAARSRKRYLPGAPGPRSPRPRAQRVIAQAAPAPRAVRARSEERRPPSGGSPGAEVRHPRGDAEPGGRGSESGQEGARSGPLSPSARPPARTPRPRCRGQARQRPPSAGPGSVTRAASAINNPQPAPGAPPVTPDPRGGAAGETMTRCTRQPSR